MISNLQFGQSWLNIWELYEDRFVRNSFVVEDEPDAPNDWGETHILFAGEIVQHDLWLGGTSHVRGDIRCSVKLNSDEFAILQLGRNENRYSQV
jgi:hypothetical protein